MLIAWPDNWSKFDKKYRMRPSECFITLGHVVWQLASRTAMAGSDVVQSGRPIFDDFFQQFCLAMKRTSG
ncbi:hypothetical protein TNCV_2104631 [Trichonephila clavipes]|nr:hypothetical protein TNCV_2104631 [Trichonephila clavipes]